MNLVTLVARLGLAEVARRVGVSPATVKLWLRQGPSARGREKLIAVTRRHVAGRKGYETRQRRATFHGSLPLPPEPFARFDRKLWIGPKEDEYLNENYGRGIPSSGELSDEQLLPQKPPVETKADLNRARKRAGYTGGKVVNTDRYYGESEWVTIGKPMLEVDVAGMARNVSSAWKISRRVWCQVRFLIFRYIPFNPLYKGEMVNRQGTWADWWTSTELFGDQQSLENGVEVAMTRALQAAASRVIWLEAMNIRTFDDKEDLPNKRALMRRRL